ncbi:Protein hit [Paraconexibacter sp. AEG42_29]|uniref:Protein hit n=1 Tax=Paraconexibacter sp. AEG42_29 TaxID=2997339 RepID=A0AAU7AYA0_9ACTN
MAEFAPPEHVADDCIFCKIIARELPAFVLDEDEHTLSFMDINPGTRGHALVIPRNHSQDLIAIEPADLQATILSAQRLAARMKDRLQCDGVNLLNCCGADAWQTVFHTHIHVIPRYKDDPERDPLRLPWIPKPGDMADIEAAAQELTA